MEHNERQAIVWTLQEHPGLTKIELEHLWYNEGVSALPGGLDYLFLECCADASVAVAIRWFNEARYATKIGYDKPVHGDGLQRFMKLVLHNYRRRNQLVAGSPAPATNRANRVTQRVMRLIKEHELDRVFAL